MQAARDCVDVVTGLHGAPFLHPGPCNRRPGVITGQNGGRAGGTATGIGVVALYVVVENVDIPEQHVGNSRRVCFNGRHPTVADPGSSRFLRHANRTEVARPPINVNVVIRGPPLVANHYTDAVRCDRHIRIGDLTLRYLLGRDDYISFRIELRTIDAAEIGGVGGPDDVAVSQCVDTHRRLGGSPARGHLYGAGDGRAGEVEFPPPDLTGPGTVVFPDNIEAGGIHLDARIGRRPRVSSEPDGRELLSRHTPPHSARHQEQATQPSTCGHTITSGSNLRRTCDTSLAQMSATSYRRYVVLFRGNLIRQPGAPERDARSAPW